ncbi:MAG: lipoate--protein ligase [Planctomycetota bacterium]
MTTIQLIRDEPGDGLWNMAADEWLMQEAARTGETLLRIYRWSAPTLSLGYFQAAGDREQHPASLPCPWVRRASGGGAIMHDQELTYALAMPQPQTRGFSQPLYDAVHDALVAELQHRGIAARRHTDASAPADRPFLCFQRRAVGDVVLNSEKILGSAQRRSAQAVVQHGSLLMRRSPYAPELPGLQDLTERILAGDELLEGWLERIRHAFDGAAFVPRSLAETAQKQIHYAACHKFGTDRWRLRR